MARTGTSAQKPKNEGKNWTIKIKEICDVHQGPYLQMWNSIIVISCVFAVSLDPLFFYVVNIDQKQKCLQTDKTLKIVALVMRSLTDVIFLVHLICEICDSVQKTMDKKSGTCVAVPTSKTNTRKNGSSAAVEQTRGNSSKKWEDRELIQHARKIAQNMSWLSIIIDVLALLPLPQLLILMFYPMKGSGFIENKKFVNVFLLGQYLPRISRIHLSAKVFKRTNGIWAKGLFNVFLYILASHVLGAFWYFFSIQREASCWHKVCKDLTINTRECMNTFYCDNNESTTAKNFTLLDGHCSLDTPTPNGDISPFNFGMFLDSHMNRNPEQKFGKKFLYSFWWGLKNLSNFGTNLTTSTYVWENLFAILISVIGLLLFIYLIGNVQTFMQMEATKTEEMRQKGGLIRLKKLDVRMWIDENKFPNDIKNDIMNSIEKALKTYPDADVHNPFLILPWQSKRSIKRFLFMDTLRKVNKLKDKHKKVLTLICDHLKPVTYSENTFVFRMGDPLDCMLFIIKGTMWTYESSSDGHAGQGISSRSIKPLGKGNFYGEELLDWESNCSTEVPVSSKHVKTRTKVEAFVLMSQDLEIVVSRCKPYWECNKPEEVALATIRRFCTKAQRRLPLSPAGIADVNGGSLPSTTSN
ncbi:cyclic nucleotide-gated ion channel 1-like [Pyrus x bretschneideri]|uniref:cyclic nucleotide-gated ion channel 1-like n=1 Tax=Pyrus x bretschneideri TaxID=225117 RepID=UPI00051103BD|nr:cyclic nucleotide-gated ion channel 1-like [Pyrus x bretschneideri]